MCHAECLVDAHAGRSLAIDRSPGSVPEKAADPGGCRNGTRFAACRFERCLVFVAVAAARNQGRKYSERGKTGIPILARQP